MVATALPAELGTGTWTIDPVHSTIGFAVRHLLVTKVRGAFEDFTGSISVDEEGTPSVTVEIAVASVHTGNEQRDGHVKSPDFFDVATYPTATFASTGVRPDGESWILDGDFTLKGVTKAISLPVTFDGVNPGMGNGEVAGFQASIVLNRRDFNVDFDAPLPTGGSVVGDRVTITLDIEALKQS